MHHSCCEDKQKLQLSRFQRPAGEALTPCNNSGIQNELFFPGEDLANEKPLTIFMAEKPGMLRGLPPLGDYTLWSVHNVLS